MSTDDVIGPVIVTLLLVVALALICAFKIGGLEDRIDRLEHPSPIRGIVGADDVHVTTTPPVRFQP